MLYGCRQVDSEHEQKIKKYIKYGKVDDDDIEWKKMFELFTKLKSRALALNQRDVHRERMVEKKKRFKNWNNIGMESTLHTDILWAGALL